MDFLPAAPVDALTATQRSQKRWAKNGRDMRETDGAYLAKPFVAWDGEGVTTEDGIHRYVMLAVKSDDGSADYLQNAEGIGTLDAFDFILDFVQEQSPKAIHVIYGGGYDFNMIFRDLPKNVVRRLYDGQYTLFAGFKIAWRPGKSLWLSRVDLKGKRVGRSVTLFDVVSFFQCAFVRACDDYLGEKFWRREMIAENKLLRSSFTLDDLAAVREYNDAELTNLLLLMNELRIRLNKVGLRPSRWDGPGAIAASLLKRERVKESCNESPPAVAEAARYAYVGGRFEVIQYGTHNNKVYEYDFNSAYPSALRNVPDLTAGEWRHFVGDPGKESFAIYHVRYSGRDSHLPGALPRRDPNGTVCYPLKLTGWYWSPEVEAAREYCKRGHGEMEVIEAWVFDENEYARKPFSFIDPLYQQRRKLKAAKDGAHVGIKLGLNSLYGKLAQQVGARLGTDGDWRLPPFHQLEWAGYTTSWCRAGVLMAVIDDLDSVIAFETDAVFTTRPLNVVVGEDLGEFGVVEFDNLTYAQSGMYFGDSEGKTIAKTRGVDRGSLTREDIMARMSAPLAIERTVDATLTRFVGAGIALNQTWSRWRTWEKTNKTLKLYPTGKRVHACECMAPTVADGKLVLQNMRGGLHTTVCPMINDAHSCEFPVLWINPNPEMSELEELRGMERMSYE